MDKNILRETTALARVICGQYADKTAIAVDATCGNGHDTLWLADMFSKVLSFDVQQGAVAMTQKLMADNDIENVTVIKDSHSNMTEYLSEADDIALVVFNLGYLPGGDKSLVTKSETTLAALRQALKLIRKDGLVCVTMYWGHEGGAEEREAVLKWAASLDKREFHCMRTDMINQTGTPPETLFITKKLTAKKTSSKK